MGALACCASSARARETAPVRRWLSSAELDLERDRWSADVLATWPNSRSATGEDRSRSPTRPCCGKWPRLREWIEEDAERRGRLLISRRRASEWTRKTRPERARPWRRPPLCSTGACSMPSSLTSSSASLDRELGASEQEAKRSCARLVAFEALLLVAVLMARRRRGSRRHRARARRATREERPKPPTPWRAGAGRGGP